MAVPRILHLAIRSRDIPRATSFYRDGLGFREIGPRPSGSGSMDLTDGHVNLTIVPFVGQPRDPAEEGLESIHFGLLVDDAPALYQRLRALGATVARHDVKERHEASEQPPPGSFKVLDPDGNVVDVTDNREEWRFG
jgi:catechol 2,3-dioxygenase-like lactoylglutathione lyase family enzyme